MKGSWDGLGLWPFTQRQVSLKTVKFVWLSVNRAFVTRTLASHPYTKSSLTLINSINLAHLNRSAPTDGCLFTAPSR